MASQNKKLVYQTSIFIDKEDDRNKLYEILDRYQSDKNVQQLANSLKKILNKPERLRMYDVARALIPMDQQMDYNMMTPYISSKSRTLKLTRRKGVSFGFAIRGGREHSTGVFVSEVDPGSEAHHQGLKVGDQILRVNGFHIDEAIHEEVINLLKSRNPLVLKVKSVGMIPVKNSDDDEAEILGEDNHVPASKSDSQLNSSLTSTSSNHSDERRGSDTISWKVVEPSESSTTTATVTHSRKTSSSNSCHSGEFPEMRVTLNNNSLNSFGCNICKGPPDNPGIFVQTIKEGGLAYKAGLRPGDQLLEANGNRLQSMEFQKTVECLKSSKQVDLVVRKGAGGYLFPGESSGYNSSNSSVNGENSVEEFHSPLAAVNEEDNTATTTTTYGTTDNNQEEHQIEVQIINQIDTAIEEAEATENLKRNARQIKKSHLKTSSAGATSSTKRDREFSLAEKKQLELFKREEEEERIRKEKMEEKLRNMEYASRLEAQMVDQDIIDNAEIILKQRRKSSPSEETRKSSLVAEEVQEERHDLAEEESDDDDGTTTGVDPLRKESGSRVPTETDGTNRRPSSSSSSGNSGSKTPTANNGAAGAKPNERWKKTILAEVHNTPSPKLNNTPSTVASDDKKNISETSRPARQSAQQQSVATNSQTNDSVQNGHQQRNQHDQLIEEFKKVHKKMIALQETDSLETSKERKKTEVAKKVEKKPVSILKKSSPEKRSEETLEIPKGNTKALSLPPDNLTMAANKELVKETTVYSPATNKSLPPNSMPDASPKVSQQSIEAPAIVAIKNGKTKAITDSSLRIPKPPDYFFPQRKSSVLVTIQSYQGENARPTPQRLQFLKTHPSIEIEMLPNSESRDSKPVMNGKRVSEGGVTKVAINKTTTNGTTKPNVANNIPPSEISTNSNVNNNNTSIRQTIEKLKSATNADEKRKTFVSTVRSAVAENSNAGQPKGVPDLQKAPYNLNSALVQNGITANGTVQPNSKIPPITKPKSVEINGNINSKSDHEDTNNVSRLAKRQRAPMLGDHKVSIQISPDPVVVISSQKQ